MFKEVQGIRVTQDISVISSTCVCDDGDGVGDFVAINDNTHKIQLCILRYRQLVGVYERFELNNKFYATRILDWHEYASEPIAHNQYHQLVGMAIVNPQMYFEDWASRACVKPPAGLPKFFDKVCAYLQKKNF